MSDLNLLYTLYEVARTGTKYATFVVEKDTPGFTTKYHMGKFSLRASVTSELVMDDVRLPAGAVLPGSATGPTGASWRRRTSCSSPARCRCRTPPASSPACWKADW